MIWLERNRRIFEENELQKEDLFEKAKILASLWPSIDSAFQDFSLDHVKLGVLFVSRGLNLCIVFV